MSGVLPDPSLIRISYFDTYNSGGYSFRYRNVLDYEMDYMIESNGGIIIDGKYVEFEKDTISFRKPGQVVKRVAPYKCYFISLDFAGEYGNSNAYPTSGTRIRREKACGNDFISSIPDKMICKNPPYLKHIFENLYYLDGSRYLRAELMRKSLLFDLFAGVLCYMEENICDQRLADVTRYITEAVKYIESCYDSDIKVEDISDHLGISISYFNQIFTRGKGISPKKYINHVRLGKAKAMLVATDSSISEVADACGFREHVYFTYFFRSSEGIAPSEYRKLYRSPEAQMAEMRTM